MQPKVSIIMGIYNCEKTLKESIESIINQSYENWELIMCDDASKDNTYQIAKKYKNKYPGKIKLIQNKKNLTLGPTLNKCLEISEGKYVARQDGDDKSVIERLEKQVKFLEKNKEYDLVATNMISFDETGEKGIRGNLPHIPTKYDLVMKVPFCHATIMMKKEVYDSLKGYRSEKYTHRVEDVDLWFRFFQKNYKGYNMNEALYLVRDDGSEYKRRNFRNYLNAFLTSIRGAWRIKLPMRYYIYSFNPIIKYMIPVSVIKMYHKKKINFREAY